MTIADSYLYPQAVTVMDDEAMVAAILMLAMARLCEMWSDISHS